MIDTGSFYIHIKNNGWAPSSFPNIPEGKEVFTINAKRFHLALRNFPVLADRIKPFFDWDEDNFGTSIARADILLNWNLPTEGLAQRSPRLR